MKLLLTNDDGIDAEGSGALLAAASGLGELLEVAPSGPQSGVSHTACEFRDIHTRSRHLTHLACPPECTVVYRFTPACTVYSRHPSPAFASPCHPTPLNVRCFRNKALVTNWTTVRPNASGPRGRRFESRQPD